MPSALKTHVENAAESMQDTGAAGASKHTTQGSVRERLKRAGERDVTYISDAEKVKWGIKEGEKCAWARDPNYWEKFEKTDRLQEICGPIEEGGKEARVVYKNGEYDRIIRGDLVLVAIPEEVDSAFQDIIDEESRRFEKPLRAENSSEYGKHAVRSHQNIHAQTGEEYDPGDLDFISDMARAEHEMNKQTGLIGGNSPTAGMTLMEAERFMASPKRQEELERKQEMLRMGGSHVPMSQENFSKLMLGGEASMKRNFGVGDTGLGKTTQQRLAARGKGA